MNGPRPNTPSAAMVRVEGLTFAYRGGAPIFQDFSWQVARGEAWAIIGPSGCGKTTLLCVLAGLRAPAAGRVLVEGAPVLGPRPGTGLILQDFGLLPWATARDNVQLGLRVRGLPRRRRRETADRWLERLGLAHVAHHYPHQLSGGQRQRVAIARTLALDPTLLLMDEPFSSLDALTREELQELVVELGVGRGLTTVLVTHNIEEAVFLGQRIMVLRQAPIQEPLVLDNPQAGDPGYRQSAAFYARCAQVRERVQEVLRGSPARA